MSEGVETSAVEYLGAVNRISIGVAVTDTPWDLGADVLVLSVGAGLGGLAEAVSNHFRLSWGDIEFGQITPARPRVVRIRSAGSPFAFVLASPHNDDAVRSVTAGSAASAASHAVLAATRHGARSIALPLIGTGLLGLNPRRATEALLRSLAEVLTTENPNGPDEVIFFDRVPSTVEIIKQALLAGGLTRGGNRELQGGISSDAVDAHAEIELDDDLLAVKPYVLMLATLIADVTTPVPLSIGIFGEWGSGKSYFMGLLRGRIAELARSADQRYVRRVKAVSFNAWHYADANLWASLADEIITQVVRADMDAEAADAIEAELKDVLATGSTLGAEIDATLVKATRLQSDLDKTARDRRVTVRALASAVRRATTSGSVAERLWTWAGLGRWREQSADFAAELDAVAAESMLLRRRAATHTGALAVVAAVVLAGAATGVALLAPSLRGAFSVLGAVFSSFAVAGVAVVAWLHNGLSLVRVLAGEISENLTARSNETVRTQLHHLREVQRKHRHLEQQREFADERGRELQQRLAGLAPGARAYSELLGRAADDFYRGHLGLISLVRQDLEALADLLADRAGSQGADRIVLYIDDLDRCPPHRVVEVLQAVHLLLAVKLFVVVIGVDPRWLLRSLNAEHREILGTSDGGAEISAEQFLSKIINIPLTLPAMSATSMVELLGAILPQLAPDVPDSESDAVTIEIGSELADQDLAVGPARPRRTARALAPPRQVTTEEGALLAAAGRLVSTPRSAKRLLNVYRMIRSTQALSDAGLFLGDDGTPGHFQAVIPLLAISVYDGAILAAVMRAPAVPDADIRGGLLTRDASSQWRDFVLDTRPKDAASGVRNGVIGNIDVLDLPKWECLADGLAEMTKVMAPIDLANLHRWAPTISRFTFTPWT